MSRAALIILDGWGIGKGDRGDAVHAASTPTFDSLWRQFPHTTLLTHGEHVGLPEGQMGNSEVGHLNIGAGRVVYQELARINKALAENELSTNEVWNSIIEYVNRRQCRLHFLGLLGTGGVHAHQQHLYGFLKAARACTSRPIVVHGFTDGRDSDPQAAADQLNELQAFCHEQNVEIGTVVGRYFAMDRDKRWERVKVAYDALVHRKGEPCNNFSARAKELYQTGTSDEFFPALISADVRGIEGGDAVVCFNFRTDRCRQLTQALTQNDLPEHDMHTLPLRYVTCTRYDAAFKNVEVLFEKSDLSKTLGEVISEAGKTQLRVAETEKYPHVSFFFSGGRENPFNGESRMMVPSPKVATYDLAPEMSATQVADAVIEFSQTHRPDFICVNFANPDMVGHTGVFHSIVKAVEATDTALGRVQKALMALDYTLIVIADHGNAEKALNDDGSPNTAHTVNLVPAIITSEGIQLREGKLADVAPSVLEIMQVNCPTEMTGQSLIMKKAGK